MRALATGDALVDQIAAAALSTAALDEAIVVTGSRGRTLRLSAEDIARMQLPSGLPPLSLSAQVCAVYAVGP